jgi:hypothetical protein
VKRPGPIQSLCEVRDFAALHRLFAASLAELEEKVATTPEGDPKLPSRLRPRDLSGGVT